jgi:hypothetical protein
LTPGEIAERRHDEKSAVERFREQIQEVRNRTQDSTTLGGPELQQSLFEKGGSFRYPNRGTGVENMMSKSEMQTSAAGAKHTAATRYRPPTPDEFTRSMDPTLQKDAVLQKGSNWPNAGRELQTDLEKPATGQYDGFVKRDAGGALVPRSGKAPGWDQRDVLGRIRQQLDDLTRTVEARLQTEPTDARKAGGAEPATERDQIRLGTGRYMPNSREAARPGRIDSSSTLGLYEPQGAERRFKQQQPAPVTAGGALSGADDGGQTRLESPETPSREGSQKKSFPLDELGKLSHADLSAEAKRIMGPHRSRESFSEAKFNQHVRAAGDYLKARRYYRAADSFALASIYKPDNPQALAGRGHALFAAGEYMSSALFLSRALAVRAEYAHTKMDLTAALGGQDKVAGRIADVEKWLARSGSGELQLLLSYVYYRTGEFSQAKQAIEAAHEKMPQSPAVHAIRMAIDDAIAKP